MIEPINISPINTTKTLKYKCDKCGEEGQITLTNSIVNIDKGGNPLESLEGYFCPKCGKEL